jgi:TetR/AcrR family transcriptional regulator
MVVENSRRRVGRPPAKQDEQARERLLQTALVLFAEDGIAGVADSAIAKRAGVTPAMIRYYFHSRDAMLDAVFEEHVLPFIQNLWTMDEARWGRSLDVLLHISEGVIEGARERPWLPRLWMREVLNGSGLLRSRLMRHLPVKSLRRLRELAIAEQEQGMIAPQIQPGLLFVSVMGLTMLPLAIDLWRNLPGTEKIGNRELAQHAGALLWHGLYGAHVPRHKGAKK